MPRPHQLKFDYVTTDFAFVRLLGDRKRIERQTKVWDNDKVIVDRSRRNSKLGLRLRGDCAARHFPRTVKLTMIISVMHKQPLRSSWSFGVRRYNDLCFILRPPQGSAWGKINGHSR